MTTPVEATTHIPITLEAQQWNVVLGALSGLPWRDVHTVIGAIRSQCDAFSQTLGHPELQARPNGQDQIRGI